MVFDIINLAIDPIVLLKATCPDKVRSFIRMIYSLLKLFNKNFKSITVLVSIDHKKSMVRKHYFGDNYIQHNNFNNARPNL